MVAIDTNVLVRLIVKDNPDQVAAAKMFVATGAWVSKLVLAETIWVLKSAYRRDHRALVSTVEKLLEHDTIIIEDPDLVKEALTHFRNGSSISFTDCLILQTARRAGHTPLGTFDRRLARLDGANQITK